MPPSSGYKSEYGGSGFLPKHGTYLGPTSPGCNLDTHCCGGFKSHFCEDAFFWLNIIQ
jgi:hypothetical protein